MGPDITGLGGTAPGASAGPADDSGDHLIWLPGRSPVLDAAQVGVLGGYGSERDRVAGGPAGRRQPRFLLTGSDILTIRLKTRT